VTNPIFQRPFSFKALGLAILGGVVYSGLVFAIFPKTAELNWQVGAAGFVSGLLGALLYWFVYLRWFKPKVSKTPKSGEEVPLVATPQDNAYEPPPLVESNHTPSWGRPTAPPSYQTPPSPQQQRAGQPQWLEQNSRRESAYEKQPLVDPSRPGWLGDAQRASAPPQNGQPGWLAEKDETRSSVNLNKGFMNDNPFLFQQEKKQAEPPAPKPAPAHIEEIFSNPFAGNDPNHSVRKDVRYGDNPFE